MTCDCALPPGSTYSHCRSCCSTWMTVGLFDQHRDKGECFNLDGVYEEAGVLGTEEGHARRRALSERFSKK